MLLETYLKKFFPDGPSQKMVDHFMDKFGVAAKLDGNLVLFKYDQLAAKWLEPITHFCRGTIFSYDGEWKLVSFPWVKFFNLHEGHCCLDEKDLAMRPKAYRLIEKADGSCIQLYYVGGEGWRVSTLGAITTMDANGSGQTFEDLFWKTVKHQTGWYRDEFLQEVETAGYGRANLFFELCTPTNRVVSRYPSPTVFLLGGRLNYMHDAPLMGITDLRNVASSLRVRLPVSFECSTGLSSKKDIEEFAENPGAYADIQCDYPEGFVLYHGTTPIGKVKNANYLALHRAIGGDRALTEKTLVRAVFAGNIDDIRDALDDDMNNFVNRIISAAGDLVRECAHAGQRIKDEWADKFYINHAPLSDERTLKKAYALLVQKHAPAEVQGMFYANREIVLANNAVDIVGDYLNDHVEQMMDKWRKAGRGGEECEG